MARWKEHEFNPEWGDFGPPNFIASEAEIPSMDGYERVVMPGPDGGAVDRWPLVGADTARNVWVGFTREHGGKHYCVGFEFPENKTL